MSQAAVWVLAYLAFAGDGASGCRELAVQQTEVGVAGEWRPTFVWPWKATSARFLVELEGRVAEGRLLASFSTYVSRPTFQPPTPLTSHRASVKIRVTTGCQPGELGRLQERAAAFFLDTSARCPVPTRIATGAGGRSIVWDTVPGPTNYEVSVRRLDGTEVQRGEVRRAEFALATEVTGPLVAVVRPYCQTGFGNRASAFIEPPER
jgi:hypothetical protein